MACALIVGEKENFAPLDGATESSTELVLDECAASGREIIARVQIGVSQELEKVAVKCVAAGLGDDVDLAAAEFAILRVKVAGKNAELGDRVEIGNDRRSHVDVFLGIAAVDDEGVGKLPLAMNGNRAWIQIRGR